MSGRPYQSPDLAELEHQMQFVPGVVVRLKRSWDRFTTEDLFVVTANNAKTVSASLLGGEGGKYVRVGHRGLEIVPIDYHAAKKALVAA